MQQCGCNDFVAQERRQRRQQLQLEDCYDEDGLDAADDAIVDEARMAHDQTGARRRAAEMGASWRLKLNECESGV